MLPLCQPDAPDLVEIVARAEEVSRKLRDIHRTPAAETDDRGDPRNSPGLYRGEQ